MFLLLISTCKTIQYLAFWTTIAFIYFMFVFKNFEAKILIALEWGASIAPAFDCSNRIHLQLIIHFNKLILPDNFM